MPRVADGFLNGRDLRGRKSFETPSSLERARVQPGRFDIGVDGIRSLAGDIGVAPRRLVIAGDEPVQGKDLGRFLRRVGLFFEPGSDNAMEPCLLYTSDAADE